MKVSNYFKKILPIIYLTCFILSTVLIFVKASETGEISSTQSSNLADFIQNNVVGMDKIAEKVEDFPTLIRKFFGHYGLFALNGFFAILTLLSFIKKPLLPFVFAGITAVFVSAVSELIQGGVEGRTPSVTDIVLNVQGFVSGSSVSLILYLLSEDKKVQTLKDNVISFFANLTLILLSILAYFIIANKSESIDFCATVEILVTFIWLIFEIIYILIKLKREKIKTA